ncbi:MAG: hypothetical protein U0269_14550 [Polyangiales bacterium]
MFSLLLSVLAQTLVAPSADASSREAQDASTQAPSTSSGGDAGVVEPANSAANTASTASGAARSAPSPGASSGPTGVSDPGPARRAPFEFTAQIVVGGGARFAPGAPAPAGFFTLAWRADMLFLRDTPRSFGIGPALAVRLDHFADVVPSLGASLLVPIHEALPLVITPSFALRWDGATWAPGASGRLFWGVRSHNYHGVYALSIGLWAEARHFFDPQGTTDVAAGIDIDMQVFAIPFVALYVELFRRTRSN